MEQERRGSGCRLTMPPPASLAARPRRVREAQAFPLLTPTTEVTAGFSPVSGGRNPPFPHSAGRRSLGLHRCAFSSGPKPGVWFCLRSPANLCSYAPKRRKVILQARDDPPPPHPHPPYRCPKRPDTEEERQFTRSSACWPPFGFGLWEGSLLISLVNTSTCLWPQRWRWT